MCDGISTLIKVRTAQEYIQFFGKYVDMLSLSSEDQIISPFNIVKGEIYDHQDTRIVYLALIEHFNCDISHMVNPLFLPTSNQVQLTLHSQPRKVKTQLLATANKFSLQSNQPYIFSPCKHSYVITSPQRNFPPCLFFNPLA